MLQNQYKASKQIVEEIMYENSQFSAQIHSYYKFMTNVQLQSRRIGGEAVM